MSNVYLMICVSWFGDEYRTDLSEVYRSIDLAKASVPHVTSWKEVDYRLDIIFGGMTGKSKFIALDEDDRVKYIIEEWGVQ